jgi:ABC-type glycerol-3-phosphate transport system permease component
VASTVTLISLVVSSLAAYSMVRFRYRFKGLFGRLILFAYLTPTSLLFIPLSILIARLQLGNTLHGLIFVYLTFSLPVSTWMLQAYFAAVPRELEEQGMIDGLSRLGALFASCSLCQLQVWRPLPSSHSQELGMSFFLPWFSSRRSRVGRHRSPSIT